MGLDKAIIQLNFNDENLHTPILILITALAADTSATFAYFFEGVQKTLVNPQYIESENKDLVM